MSFVSRLQEYCQKNKCDVPKYTSNYLSGPSHQPIYEITCEWNNLNNVIQSSKIKKGKEMLAETFLNQIPKDKKEKNIIVSTFQLDQPLNLEIKHKNENINIKQSIDAINEQLNNVYYTGIVFVDHENVNINADEMFDNYYYVLVSSKNCTKYPINQENSYNVKCSFVGKDVADTLLIYLAGKLNIDDKQVFIFTKDHYGDSLARIVNGYHVCNIDEIFNLATK